MAKVAAEALVAASREMAKPSKRKKRYSNKRRGGMQRKIALYTIGERLLQYKEALHAFRVRT